jgi:hypothetical protein
MVTHFPRLNYGRLIFLLYRRNLDTSQPSDSRDPVPPLLKPAQTRLSFGSGLLTLFTHRGALKTHLTRTRQLLTRGPKGVSSPSHGSQIYDHSFPIFPPIFSPIFFPILSPILSPIFSPISPIPLPSLQQRPFFFVPTPNIYIRAGRILHTTSTERAKGCWRGLNPDEQIEAALRDGLSEDRSGIDSNLVRRELGPISKPQYAAMMEVWKACVDIIKSSLEYQPLTRLRYERKYPSSDPRNMENMKHFAEAVGRSTSGRLDKTKRQLSNRYGTRFENSCRNGSGRPTSLFPKKSMTRWLL